MKTYTITQEHKERLFNLINRLIQAPWKFDDMGNLQRALDELGALPEKHQDIKPETDNLCDKCGEPVPLGALFWHNDKRIGFFCKKCFCKLNKSAESGYVTLEKYHSSPSGKEPKKRPVK